MHKYDANQIISKLNLDDSILESISSSEMNKFISEYVLEDFMKVYLKVFIHTYTQHAEDLLPNEEVINLEVDKFARELYQNVYEAYKDLVSEEYSSTLDYNKFVEKLEIDQDSILCDIDSIWYFFCDSFDYLSEPIGHNIIYERGEYRDLKNKHYGYLISRIVNNLGADELLYLGYSSGEEFDPIIKSEGTQTGTKNSRQAFILFNLKFLIHDLIILFYEGDLRKIDTLKSSSRFLEDYSNLYDYLKNSSLKEYLNKHKFYIDEYDISVNFFGILKQDLMIYDPSVGEKISAKDWYFYKDGTINMTIDQYGFKKNFIFFLVNTYIRKKSGENLSYIGIPLNDMQTNMRSRTTLAIREFYVDKGFWRTLKSFFRF